MAFLMDVSTLSFWLYHHGPWYLAMLIPVYLCMPWYGKPSITQKIEEEQH